MSATGLILAASWAAVMPPRPSRVIAALYGPTLVRARYSDGKYGKYVFGEAFDKAVLE